MFHGVSFEVSYSFKGFVTIQGGGPPDDMLLVIILRIQTLTVYVIQSPGSSLILYSVVSHSSLSSVLEVPEQIHVRIILIRRL